jgi:hypothetical protein
MAKNQGIEFKETEDTTKPNTVIENESAKESENTDTTPEPEQTESATSATSTELADVLAAMKSIADAVEALSKDVESIKMSERKKMNRRLILYGSFCCIDYF